MNIRIRPLLIYSLLLPFLFLCLSENHAIAQGFWKELYSSSLIKKGKRFKADGDYASAITKFSKSIRTEPDNLEAYYQESGRAGRDNLKAYAVSLYNINDIENLETNLDLKYPEHAFLSKVYQCLCNYYKLAFESEVFESFDFEIQNFAAIYLMTIGRILEQSVHFSKQIYV